ncbi:MAG: oligosaccharide flippase family protein [Candidatus Marinimicrobia bacterium]|nr:oligosaccharide flippase family protein [Candidatus Neomarinimicrobiota bacterium]
MPKLLKKIGYVAIIMISASGFQMASNLILGRELTKEEYGIFSLIRKIIQFSSWILVFGTDVGLIRLFNRSITKYNWKKFLNRMLLYSFFLSVIPLLIFLRAYSLSNIQIISTVLIIFITITLILGNGIFRIQNKYNLAQFVISGVRYLFFVCLVILWFTNCVTLNNSILVFTLSYLIFGLLCIYYLNAIPNGRNFIPLKDVIKESSEFYFITIVTVSLIVADTFIVAKYFAYEYVGIYAAVSILPVTVFNLAGSSIGQVLMPSLAKGEINNFQKVIYISIGIALILYILFNFIGEDLLHYTFNSKYDGNSNLFYIFICMGITQYFSNIIHFSIGGISTKESQKYFLLSTIILTVLYLLLINYLIITHIITNITSVAIITVLVWVIRDFMGIYLIIKSRKKWIKS